MGSMVLVDKAEAFRQDAETAGWSTDIKQNGARVTILASRSNEVVSVTWEGNACLNECMHTIDGKDKKLRNAAAARRVLIGSSPKTSSQSDSSSTKASAKAKVVPQPRVEVEQPDVPRRPPSWGARHISKPDAEILELVRGKEITWINSRTKEVETAVVMPRQLKIMRTAAHKRVVTFASKGEGFRSIYLDAIASVK